MVFSKELLDSLFKYPYAKIKFIEYGLGICRQTEAKYLDQLMALGLLTPHKIGKTNYYANHPLFDLLSNASQ